VGQKVHPYGLRIKIIRDWNSKWFARKNYAEYLHEDLQIRKIIIQRLSHAGISKVEIERFPRRLRVNIKAARPGIIIGRRGSEVEKLKALIQSQTDKTVFINIVEVKQPERDAQLIAEGIGVQLVRRVSVRRAMKKAQQAAMQSGALGVKIMCSGRLGGSEMARKEMYHQGRVPLHTLRADIDYGFYSAVTSYGTIGVKVWVFNGEVIGKGPVATMGEES
jgi:small subunit ribosomal protein S3